MPLFTKIEHDAMKAAGASIRLLRVVGGPLKSIAEQGIRAASSAALQSVEGFGRTGRDRASKLRGGYAEAREACAVLVLLAASGDIDEAAIQAPLETFDRVRAQLWRCLHPR